MLAQLIEVTSASGATDLASRVLNPQRSVPLVVVSLPGDVTTSSGVVDVDELRTAVGIRADVAIVGAHHVDVFNRALPMGLAVFGDAVRVYPSSSSWSSKPPHCEVVAAGRDLGYGLWRLRDVVDAVNPPRRRATIPTTPAGPGTTGPAPDVISGAGSWRPDAAPAATVQRVLSLDDADALAALLLSSARVHPVVVVTTPTGRDRAWIDAESVVRELAGLAWVFDVPSGRLTFRLNDTIGAVQGVYGGAGRVYSPDLGWVREPHRSVLRTVYDQRQGDRVTDELVADALGMVAAGPRSSSSATAGEHVSGTVGMLVPPTRAMVRLDDGRPAAIWGDTIPGASGIDRVVKAGQHVEGLLDPTSGRLNLHAHLNAVDVLLEDTGVGDVILTRVKDVSRDQLLLTVWPGADVPLDADQVTGNPLDDLRDLATPGEVVPARVLALPQRLTDTASRQAEAGSGWQLSLLDIDYDDEPTSPPPPLLPGGPAWIAPITGAPDFEPTAAPPPQVPSPAGRRSLSPATTPGVPSPTLITPSTAAATVTPAESLVAAEVVDLRAEVGALRATVQSQQEEIARLRAAGDRLRTTNRRARTNRTGADKADPVREVHGFTDPEEQLRWEVYRTWVEQTRPEDKMTRPLPTAWHVGPRFLESLSLPGVARDKVLSVVVHVLTGNPPRETHVLRTALSGNAPQVQREDGSLAWRTPIQQNTPSARRLHWWRRQDRSIELSRIVLHDDYQP